MTLLKLSVVIVNYRSWAALERCLSSVRPTGTREVVVVDNASGDGNLPSFAARHGGVRFIDSPVNRGFAGGCNLGAAQATGQWLLFLNPDTVDPGGQIERLLEAAEGRRADIATCRQHDDHGQAQKVFDAFPSLSTLLPLQRSLLRVARPGRYPDARRCGDSWRTVDWVSGSALLVRREFFTRLGGWSEAFFMYSEDVDLCRRASDAGGSIGFTADVTLIHSHGVSSRSSPAVTGLTKAETTLSRHIYVSRHFGSARAAAHILLFVGRALPTLVQGALGVILPVQRLKIRRLTAGRLLGAYLGRIRTGKWQSSVITTGLP